MIVMFGLLLGYQAVVGILLGLNFVGIHTTIISLIIGNSLRNARTFNELSSTADKEGLIH